MKKKETLKIRKSGFNPDRACYLTADGKYYCYKFEDIETGQTVTQKLEIGKDLSLELTTILDEADRNPEDAMFSEPEPENPLVAQVRRVIDEDCTEAQQNFFFEHFGMETDRKSVV